MTKYLFPLTLSFIVIGIVSLLLYEIRLEIDQLNSVEIGEEFYTGNPQGADNQATPNTAVFAPIAPVDASTVPTAPTTTEATTTTVERQETSSTITTVKVLPIESSTTTITASSTTQVVTTMAPIPTSTTGTTVTQPPSPEPTNPTPNTDPPIDVDATTSTTYAITVSTFGPPEDPIEEN